MAGQSQLQVDTQELRARAAELQAPILGLPSKNPVPSCGLALAATRARDIGLNAAVLRTYLDTGEQERQRLAQALRNAAQAYDQLDQHAAEEINTGGSVSAVTPDPVEIPASTAGRPQLPPNTTNGADYLSWKTGVPQVHSGDQGASLAKFSEALTDYRRNLLAATQRFVPFQSWYGDAATAAQQALEQHRQWLYQMADLCNALASQADDLKSAQRWIWEHHPTTTDLKRYRKFAFHGGGWGSTGDFVVYTPSIPFLLRSKPRHKQARWLDSWFQRKSERALAEYTRRTALSVVNPSAAQSIPGAPGPLSSRPGGDLVSPVIPTAPVIPAGIVDSVLPAGQPVSDLPQSGLPFNGVPQSPGSGRQAAAGAGAPRVPLGPGLKPASVGGGGGEGAPGFALQSPLGAESGSLPTAGRAVAGSGGGIAGAPGALGGVGGPGLAPIGPGAANQDNKKGKRGPHPDETLYTEDRAHTEGIIGQRRRNDTADRKDAK